MIPITILTTAYCSIRIHASIINNYHFKEHLYRNNLKLMIIVIVK